MTGFYWYDLETFGIDPRHDRIAQFAGVRTDAALNPVGEPDVFYCRPAGDVLPDPGSCLITGITPQKAQAEGLAEHAFADRVQALFSQGNTCVAGYNSLRFDDEFVRHLLYRNLHDAYRREWAGGNSRWDLIDLVRATHALRPEGLNWPRHESGLPSFKLEDLSAANGLMHTAAHDALSDVEATIALARLIREKQPKLFDWYLSLRDKKGVARQLDWHTVRPVVHVSGMIPPSRGCLTLMAPLAAHPHNANAVICYDLAQPPQDLLALDVDEIQDRLYTPAADLPEGVERVPLKSIHINKAPFVAPIGVLREADLERIGLDLDACKAHLAEIQAHPEVGRKVAAVMDQPFSGADDDVDAQLYSGFFSNDERARLDDLRQAGAALQLPAPGEFNDPRAAELVWRFKARNFPESLDATQWSEWQSQVKTRLEHRHGAGCVDWFEHLAALRKEHPDGPKAAILDRVEQHVRALDVLN